MAGARDKREKAEQQQAQQAASDNQANMSESTDNNTTELQRTTNALREDAKLRAAANMTSSETLGVQKKQLKATNALIAATALASISQTEVSRESEAGNLMQKELEDIAGSMEGANKKELEALAVRTKMVKASMSNLEGADREAVEGMVQVTETSINEMKKTIPGVIGSKMEGVTKSVTGVLDKSIGRNLLNRGMKLFGMTSLDARKEAKKKAKEFADAQLKAQANDLARQKNERLKQREEDTKNKKDALDQQTESQEDYLSFQTTPEESAAAGQQEETFGPSPDDEEATVWQQLAAEGIEEGNELLRDGLGVRSPGYLNDMLEFFKGDKLDKVQDRREAKIRSDEQIAALEALEGDGQSGTVAVEAKGAKGGGLFGAIAGGFKGLLGMLKSVGTFIKDLIVGIFDMVAKIMKSIGEGIGGLLKGIAKGLNAFKKESLIGAAAMVVVAGALWVMAKALQQFSKGVSWKGVAIGLVSMAALAVVTKLMTGSIAGAAAMIIIAGAMWVLGKAMVMFNEINWKAVAVALVTIVALGAVAVGLGAIAPLALIGAAAMLVIGSAMYVVASALKVVAEAMDLAIPFFRTMGDVMVNVIGAIGDFIQGIIGKIVDSLIEIAALDAENLKAVAISIGHISGALVELGASLAGGGIMASIGEFFTWLSGAESPVDVLQILAKIGPELQLAASAITAVVNGLADVAKMGEMDVSDGLGEHMEELNDALDELDENKINKKVKALDKLASAMTPKVKTKPFGGGVLQAVSNMFVPEEMMKKKKLLEARIVRDDDEIARIEEELDFGALSPLQAKHAPNKIRLMEERMSRNIQELVELQKLIKENAELQGMTTNASSSIVNAPSNTYVDNSGDTYVAPESSSNSHSMSSTAADIDAI
jgi:hypothetical protein